MLLSAMAHLAQKESLSVSAVRDWPRALGGFEAQTAD